MEILNETSASILDADMCKDYRRVMHRFSLFILWKFNLLYDTIIIRISACKNHKTFLTGRNTAI